MKTAPAVSPSDDCIEGHVPGDAHGHHGHEDRERHDDISPAVLCLQALQNRTNLKADEDERQDVQNGNNRLPNGVGRYAYACMEKPLAATAPTASR